MDISDAVITVFNVMEQVSEQGKIPLKDIDKAYIEIELKSEDETVILPPFINVIKDVSTDRSYTNLSLAKIYGKVL